MKSTLLFFSAVVVGIAAELPTAGLMLDLDAARGLMMEDGDRVAAWRSEIQGEAPLDFIKRDQGREALGSGRPRWRKTVPELNGKPVLVFRQQELCCLCEDHFDALTQGSGNTWMAVISVHEQRVGLKDVNSFFGNLQNGGNYEGLWGCLDDDNTPWWGGRNGWSFGRFDANNPRLAGPQLEIGRFYLLAGRMAAGQGSVAVEFFINIPTPAACAVFPVNPGANPSRMAIGQERDAIEHPGKESFDGEIARFLIWRRPLADSEMQAALNHLKTVYGVTDIPADLK
jgi:hypothetical protein